MVGSSTLSADERCHAKCRESAVTDTTRALRDRLRIPAIASPMFIISNPELVVAQCTSGIVGSFPALNARTPSQLDEWLAYIAEALSAWTTAHPDRPAAPFAVNQIVHRSNDRLASDLDLCVKHRVPIIITSLGARPEVNDAVHQYGGITLHDVINQKFAHKAIEKGADGLIAVATGAGGHAGTLSPFALTQEIRTWWKGPLVLSGAISTGRALLAAEVLGADFGYIGSAFIATNEANAVEDYKRAIVESAAEDIIYTNFVTGVSGNYLKSSIRRAGLDPDNLPVSHHSAMSFASDHVKPWRDIWGSGQGIGSIHEICPASALIGRIAEEYFEARSALNKYA